MINPKILIPLDFSELSEHAIMAAATLATTFDGSVTPFHAYIPITDLDGFYYAGSGATSHQKHTEIEKNLKLRLLDLAEKHLDEGHIAQPVLDIGNPAKAITFHSRDYDLIIMSTHGRTGFSRFVMGSVTEKVLRMCGKPIITVSKKSDLSKLTKLMVTTDFSENSFEVFAYANVIAEKTGATIDLVHVVSTEYFFDANAAKSAAESGKSELGKIVEDYFSNIKNQVKTSVITGNNVPYSEIQALCKTEKYDLVFISSVGRSGLEHLMMGSTASQVIRSVDSPVFTINPQGISGESVYS